MAAFKVFLLVTLALSAQWLVEARTVNVARDLDDDFKNLAKELDTVVSEQAVKAQEVLEPEYQQLIAAAKEDLTKAIQELDATEKNALKEVDDAAAEAEGNVGDCVDADKQKMVDVSEEARRNTEDCVGKTTNAIDEMYEEGMNAVLELKVLGVLYETLYKSCEIDDCKEIVNEMFKDEIGTIPSVAKEVTKAVSEKMANAISNVEETCFQGYHQGLRVDLRKIVDRIEECIASQ